MSKVRDVPDLLWALLLELRETGHLTLAAQRLGVSQPAVSKALAKGEAALGVTLVQRDQRPLLLTQEGALLADYAMQRRDMDDLLGRRLEVIQKQGAGLVRVASFGASSSTRILPPLLQRLRRALPEVEIELVETTDQGARQALRDGLVDFATVVGAEDEALDYIPLAQDRLVGLLPEGHSLTAQVTVSPADLAREDFIMTKGGSEPLVRDWFRLAGHSPRTRHTALQLTSILALVRSGFGVSVVAELAVPENHPQVRVAELAPVQQRDIYLCRNGGEFGSHAARRFWTLLARENRADF